MNDRAIACEAIFYKATTTVDGGWRVSFDLSEQDANKVAQMTALRGSMLYLTIIPEDAVSVPEENA